jgi:hypothetical protein
MNIIIPLGGRGERFKREGYDTPKPLIKVFDKEILFHVIDNLLYSDVSQDIKINIYIIYNKELENYNFSNIIKNKYNEINLIELEHDTKGATETVYIGICNILKNRNKTNDCLYKKTLLIDGDTFYTKNIIEMFYNKLFQKECKEDFQKYSELHGTVFYTKNYDIKPLFSYIDINENGIIKEIIEKVKISDNANTGAYGFTDIYQLQKYAKYVLDNNILFNNECYTSCIIDTMIKDGCKFYGIELNDKDVHVLGTPEQVRFFENCNIQIVIDYK